MKHGHVLLLAFLLLGCRSNGISEQNKMEESGQQVRLGDPAVASEAVDTVAGVAPVQGDPQGSVNAPPPAARHIIKTARLEMECEDFNAFSQKVQALVKAQGGWIAAEVASQNEYQHQNTLTVKVPVERFDALVTSLAGSGGKLQLKQIAAEDVTRSVIDTRGRLEARKLIRARYLELLKQAKTMEEILQVQGEINRITEEVESAAYNLQHMQAEAAYSTVHLMYYQVLSDVSDAGGGFLTRLGHAFQDGARGIVELVLAMVAFWPLLLLAGVLAYAWKRRRRVLSGVRSDGNRNL